MEQKRNWGFQTHARSWRQFHPRRSPVVGWGRIDASQTEWALSLSPARTSAPLSSPLLRAGISGKPVPPSHPRMGTLHSRFRQRIPGKNPGWPQKFHGSLNTISRRPAPFAAWSWAAYIPSAPIPQSPGTGPQTAPAFHRSPACS